MVLSATETEHFSAKTQCKVPQPRVGQCRFTRLSQAHYINHATYKHTLITKDGTGT